MDEPKLYCPLMFDSDQNIMSECQREACAWWVKQTEELGCCAIKVIANSDRITFQVWQKEK